MVSPTATAPSTRLLSAGCPAGCGWAPIGQPATPHPPRPALSIALSLGLHFPAHRPLAPPRPDLGDCRSKGLLEPPIPGSSPQRPSPHRPSHPSPGGPCGFPAHYTQFGAAGRAAGPREGGRLPPPTEEGRRGHAGAHSACERPGGRLHGHSRARGLPGLQVRMCPTGENLVFRRNDLKLAGSNSYQISKLAVFTEC